MACMISVSHAFVVTLRTNKLIVIAVRRSHLKMEHALGDIIIESLRLVRFVLNIPLKTTNNAINCILLKTNA